MTWDTSFQTQRIPQLSTEHLSGATILPSRLDIIPLLPKNAVGMEVGVLAGDFSAQLLAKTCPVKFTAVDKFSNHDWPHQARFGPDEHEKFYRMRFAQEIEQGIVEIEVGLSQQVLPRLSHRYDWIYIDGDHSYESVRQDLRNSHKLLKADGMLVINDYILYDQASNSRFGVIPAVNEFCIEYNYKLRYLALEENMYCDVVLSQY